MIDNNNDDVVESGMLNKEFSLYLFAKHEDYDLLKEVLFNLDEHV